MEHCKGVCLLTVNVNTKVNTFRIVANYSLLVNAYDAQSSSWPFKYGQQEGWTKQVKVKERDKKVGELPRRGGTVHKIRTEGCL